jgi:hypothetical protein
MNEATTYDKAMNLIASGERNADVIALILNREGVPMARAHTTAIAALKNHPAL